ncbi:MAG: type II toxin-antitoxin system death-on-curing family toxin [Mycobacteriales bacterium]
MRYLDPEDLLHLADLAVGGKALVRDFGLIASAAARPGSGFGDFESYATVHLKAAALLHSLVRDHALVDGNKRLGWTAMVVFYDLNGVELDAPDDPAYDLVIAVAEGRLDVPDVAGLLERWARPRG